MCVYFNIDSSSCLTLLFVEIGEFPNHGFSVFFHWFKTICVMQAKHFLLKEREREREKLRGTDTQGLISDLLF